MHQLGFELAQRGAERAADHADRLHDGWSELALAAFKAYAERHEEFATEDVIAASLEVPHPPDPRAWGQITMAAKRLQFIVSANRTRPTKSAHAHGRDVKLWTSLLCEAVPA